MNDVDKYLLIHTGFETRDTIILRIGFFFIAKFSNCIIIVHQIYIKIDKIKIYVFKSTKLLNMNYKLLIFFRSGVKLIFNSLGNKSNSPQKTCKCYFRALIIISYVSRLYIINLMILVDFTYTIVTVYF